MHKTGLLIVTLLCAAVAAKAGLIGFDRPPGNIGQVVTGTTFDNGWSTSLNGDTNTNARAFWYGSPPNFSSQAFAPDPGAIAGYKGGAVWLDSAALVDGEPITPNNGLTLSKTVTDTAGLVQNLSFFLATEVTPSDQVTTNPKGNPGTCFLFVNGVMIKGNGADGAFESEGPNPQFSPGSWTKYNVSFIGTGSDLITFRDDEQGTEGENLVEETNSVLADVSISQVPEIVPVGLLAAAALCGLLVLEERRRKLKA